jgi:hypothetical protein
LTSAELVSLIVAAISGTFSLMLSAIIWLIKHAANTERTMLVKLIEEAKTEAHNATSKLQEEIELRHKQELRLTQHDGKFLAVYSDVDRLGARDDVQQQTIERLKERLDRGARTMSQMTPAVRREEPGSDPPIPPMRPRLPSRRDG